MCDFAYIHIVGWEGCIASISGRIAAFGDVNNQEEAAALFWFAI